MRALKIAMISLSAFVIQAQDAAPPADAPAQPQAAVYKVEAGKRIPLTVMKSVSTKNAVPGDPIYLETIFPVISSGRIVIPRGSYVSGSVTSVKRAGKVKGRAELRIKLESLILPSGVTHDFHGSLNGIDAQAGEELDKEGSIKGKGNKAGDFKNVMTGAGVGAMAGAAAGGIATIGATGSETATGAGSETQAVREATSVFRKPIIGSSIGTVAGAAAVFTATLFMRGPDAVLAKGTDVDMILDSPVTFEESDFAASSPQPAVRAVAPPQPGVESRQTPSGLKRR